MGIYRQVMQLPDLQVSGWGLVSIGSSHKVIVGAAGSKRAVDVQHRRLGREGYRHCESAVWLTIYEYLARAGHRSNLASAALVRT